MLVALTLRVGDASLYEFTLPLPGVSSIRAVSRIVLVMALLLAIMAACGVENLQRWFKQPSWLVPAALVAALSIETLSYQPFNTPISVWRIRSDAVARATVGKRFDKDAVVYLSGISGEPPFLTELDAMLFAQERRLPTLNGYSGNSPPGYAERAPCASPALWIFNLPPDILSARGITSDALLARTAWIAAQECGTQHISTEASTPPPPAN